MVTSGRCGEGSTYIDDDGVASVGATGNTGADIIVSRDNINQLSLALVTPLGAHDHVDVATLVVVVVQAMMLLVQKLVVEGGRGDDGSLLMTVAVGNLLWKCTQPVDAAFGSSQCSVGRNVPCTAGC